MLKLDKTPANGVLTRGVFREQISPPNEVWFKIVTSIGAVGIVHLPVALCDALLEENLWKRLDAKDPLPEPSKRHLKAF